MGRQVFWLTIIALVGCLVTPVAQAEAGECEDFQALSLSWLAAHKALEAGLKAELSDADAIAVMETVAELAGTSVVIVERLVAAQRFTAEAQGLMKAIMAIDQTRTDSEVVAAVLGISEAAATLAGVACIAQGGPDEGRHLH